MTDLFKPRDESEVIEAVRSTLADGKTLEIVGHGTKRAVGRPAQTDAALDFSEFSGINLYEPEELVLSVKPGTPMAEIERLLAQNHQQLAFEPMDCSRILGGNGPGTIGGAIAANLSGPRRIKAGAARDHVLGIQAVSGRGEAFKSGGRVVKNVTGYDLPKLLAGSWGTLAAFTALTLKVLPRPEDELSVLVLGLDETAATAAMADAMGSPCEVSGASFAPERVAPRLPVSALAAGGRSVTVLRLEGIPASIASRRTKLEELLSGRGELAALGRDESQQLWRAIRDVVPFADGTFRALWRISTAPSMGAVVARQIVDATGADVLFDWAGGLIWAQMPSAIAEENVVHAAVGAHGHALLFRAEPSVRATAAVFQPLDAPVAALTRRIKDSFDPRRVLNPGRMFAGV